jgi:hypothetical protein
MYRRSKNVLASVLTPKSREDARRSLNGESMDEEHAEVMKEIEEELEDFSQAESLGPEDRLLMVEGEIVVDETGEALGLIDEEEQDSEASQQTISPKEDIADFSGREDLNAGRYYQAEEGLLRILQQFFRVGDDHPDMDSVIGTLQEYMRNTDHDLCLKPIPNLNQYAWITARGKNAFSAVLSDIAFRLESLACNEGVNTGWECAVGSDEPFEARTPGFSNRRVNSIACNG